MAGGRQREHSSRASCVLTVQGPCLLPHHQANACYETRMRSGFQGRSHIAHGACADAERGVPVQAEFAPARILKLAGQRSAAAEASGCWRYLLEWRRTDAGSPAVPLPPPCLRLAPGTSAPCLHRAQDQGRQVLRSRAQAACAEPGRAARRTSPPTGTGWRPRPAAHGPRSAAPARPAPSRRRRPAARRRGGRRAPRTRRMPAPRRARSGAGPRARPLSTRFCCHKQKQLGRRTNLCDSDKSV
jgi:hypothetical protein